MVSSVEEKRERGEERRERGEERRGEEKRGGERGEERRGERRREEGETGRHKTICGGTMRWVDTHKISEANLTRNFRGYSPISETLSPGKE